MAPDETSTAIILGLVALPTLALTLTIQSKSNVTDLTLGEALAYKKLTPLHKGLRDMDREMSALCAPASSWRGVHYKPLIQTYGNKLALNGAKMTKQPRFAVGSVLVKEKFERKDAKKPTLITVMKKVYEGVGARTWQYMMVDTVTNKVLHSADPKRLKDPSANKCISCHDQYSGSDGVSMSFAK